MYYLNRIKTNITHIAGDRMVSAVEHLCVGYYDAISKKKARVGKHVPPDGIGCKMQRTDSLQNRPRSEGQKCKYAEKSYKYKYDLGQSFFIAVVITVVLLRSSCTERERA